MKAGYELTIISYVSFFVLLLRLLEKTTETRGRSERLEKVRLGQYNMKLRPINIFISVMRSFEECTDSDWLADIISNIWRNVKYCIIP